MDATQERALRRDMATQEQKLRGSASQDPRQGGSRGGFESAAPAPKQGPAVEPYAPGPPSGAAEMGGAVDKGGPPIEYGPNGERVGPQSSSGFGDLFTSEDANNLAKIVRHGRLARQIATTKTPTFGEVAAQTREQQAAVPPPTADPQAQATQLAQSIRFLVDTRTGHFEPVMPDQEQPHVGPHDIFISLGEDPSQPNILAQGKRVTAQAMSRLADPKRAIQPALRPGYKVPEQYAHIAQALGVGGG